MTMQIPNSLVYRDEAYTLITWKPSEGLFRPAQFGIVPERLNTGCLRGWLCTYEIKDDALFLASLRIRSKNGLYPLINETPPSFPDALEKGRARSANYENIGQLLRYSGIVQFGKDIDPRWRATTFGLFEWMYHRCYEADIDNGHVRSVTDISTELAKIRAQQEPEPDDDEF